MPDMNMIQETVQKGYDLADQTSEKFILAVTAAYLAGIDQGSMVLGMVFSIIVTLLSGYVMICRYL